MKVNYKKSNSRSTTLLGAETLTGTLENPAEEAVCRLTQNPQQQ